MVTMRALRVLLLLAPAISAHFTLDYPPSFGFDEDKEPTAPCGGFNFQGQTTDFSLAATSGYVQVDSHHPSATLQINAIPGLENVTATSTGLTLKTFSMTGLGTACLPVSVPSSAPLGNYTLQVIFNGPDGILYQVSSSHAEMKSHRR